MKTEENLKTHWDNIDFFSGGSLRLGINHQLEWYVSFLTQTSKALVVISEHEARGLESSKSIATTCNLRADGKYYISFQLVDMKQEDIFIQMCSDIIDYSSAAKNDKDAIELVSNRYLQWRRLMEKKSEGILSSNQIKGLIGELKFLQRKLLTSKNYTDTVAGWVGPEGADQDFVYNQIWHEVKSIGLASDSVSINSIEQLGNNNQGYLYIYRIDKCAPEAEGALTLRSLVNELLFMIENDLAATVLLMAKLNYAGYIDLELYDKYPYKCFGFDKYDVDSEFPRLCRGEIRKEITNCAYSLSIPSIDRWKVGHENG